MSSRSIDRVRGAQQRYRADTQTDSAEFERYKKLLHSEIIDQIENICKARARVEENFLVFSRQTHILDARSTGDGIQF